MKQYAIKGFNEIILSDTTYQSITKPENRLLWIDKCNWVVTAIIKKSYAVSKSYSEYVNIHSKTMKLVLGDKYYKKILDCLEALNIIDINAVHSASRFSKSYKLTSYSLNLGFANQPILSTRFSVTLDRFYKKEFDKIYSNPLFRKLLDNTAKLFIVNEKLHYYYRVSPRPKKNETTEEYIQRGLDAYKRDRMDRYDDYFESLLELNNTTNPLDVFKSSISYKPKIGKQGRVYHLVASIPRYVRECLRTKEGRLIYEIDMASAQPSILILEWISWLKKNGISNDERIEANVCATIVFQGEFYSYVVENSKFLSKLEYKEMKQAILTSLNAKHYPSDLNKELDVLFPNFMRWLKRKKQKEGHQSISFLGQSSEAKIFVDTYKKIPNELFCLLIHDSILVEEKDVELVKKLLIERVLELYGSLFKSTPNLERLFKVSSVSVTDKDLPSNTWAQKDFEDILTTE
jgi:hypothetical protein